MTVKPIKAELRGLAIATARAQFRIMGLKAEDMTADDALTVLDDLLRDQPHLWASIWYDEASDNQIKLFKREWATWVRYHHFSTATLKYYLSSGASYSVRNVTGIQLDYE